MRPGSRVIYLPDPASCADMSLDEALLDAFKRVFKDEDVRCALLLLPSL